MAKRAPSRRIEDPVVAAPPAGVRLRTRIQVTDVEAAALTVIAITLGELYRAELANRVRLGRLEREAQWAWRAERKHAITAVSSSRWAGAITRAVEDQYQLGMRGLAAHVASLRRAIGALEARCALRPGAVAEGSTIGGRGRAPSGLPDRGGTLRQDSPLGTATRPTRHRGAGVSGGAPIDRGGWEAIVAHPKPTRHGTADRTAVAGSVGRRADVYDRRRGIRHDRGESDDPRR